LFAFDFLAQVAQVAAQLMTDVHKLDDSYACDSGLSELSNEKIMMRPKELQSSKSSIEDFR
jgi:hypothetical protein